MGNKDIGRIRKIGQKQREVKEDTTNKEIAEDCYANWQKEIDLDLQKQGWEATIRQVDSWDEVPVNALKLN